MRKAVMIGFLAFLILGIGAFIYSAIASDQSNVTYDKTFELPSKPIKGITIGTLEQPASIIVKESDQEKTNVHVQGKLAQSNIDALEKKMGYDDGDLTIATSEGDFSMTVMGKKPKLSITITLGKHAKFSDFYLLSSNGDAAVTLPKSFDGQFNLTSRAGDITHRPKSGSNTKRQAKIEVNGDLQVHLK